MVTNKPSSSMRQIAPYPELLVSLVERLSYKPGWSFRLADIDRNQGSQGLTFMVTIFCPDTNDVSQQIAVNHFFIVPAAAYNEVSWQRWLFDQIMLVEQHEAAEFLKIDGSQPYAPNHGPGYDPYTIREFTTPDERSIDYRGERKTKPELEYCIGCGHEFRQHTGLGGHCTSVVRWGTTTAQCSCKAWIDAR